MKASYLLWGLFLTVGSLGGFFVALNDLKIFLRGAFDEETNPTDIPIEEWSNLEGNASFIRRTACVRLLFAVIWLLCSAGGLVLLLMGKLNP